MAQAGKQYFQTSLAIAQLIHTVGQVNVVCA